MNDEEIMAVFNRLGEAEKQSFLQSLVQNLQQNLQLQGSAQDFQNESAKGYGYGGRIGYSFPMENDKLTVGMSGSGFKAETPFGTFADRGITGGDISYKFGPNNLSLMYDKMGQLPGQRSPYETPMEDYLRLMYRREF